MRRALELSEVRTCQIDALSACANGLPSLDNAERDALHRLFEGCRKPKVARLKAILGETFGASSVFSGILGTTLVDGKGVPSYLDATTDIFPDASTSAVTNGIPHHVLVNGVEVGGTCTSMVFKSYRDRTAA